MFQQPDVLLAHKKTEKNDKANRRPMSMPQNLSEYYEKLSC